MDVTAARRFSVAPMMDWTDRHCRFFHRRLTRRALLFTEMVVAEAILHGDRDRFLAHDAEEHPLALQLGGSDPARLAEAARIGADYGYGEINLNVGCPSDRVQSGTFGACLMRVPALVGDCVAAMRAAVPVPVTVKCRIGVDEQDPGPALDALADAVLAAGAEALYVHARKAWLKGLSPKENREVPPLDYGRVQRLKARRPDAFVALNGGLRSLEEALPHLAWADGVMLGRGAYQDPGQLAAVDRVVFGVSADDPDPVAAAEAMIPYVEARRDEGVFVSRITRHMLGLFHGRPGARAWRRRLSTDAVRPGAGAEVIRAALAEIILAEQRGEAEGAVAA